MNGIREIVIFYFSGTGNAKQIALWFSEFATQRDIFCKTFDISKTDAKVIESISSDTLIGIISPIHGFNFPKITLRFIEHFPKEKNNIVLMNTRAGLKIGRFVTPGLTGIAFLLSSFIAKTKGYKIVGQIPFDMPSNWLSIHPALNEHSIKFIHKINYQRVEKHAAKIFSGKTDFLSNRDLIQDILILPLSIVYYWAGRFALAKSFYAFSDCNNCGLCLKQCPVKAIKIVNDRPYWTFKCENCMKCMNSCPQKAIEAAHGLFLIVCLSSSALIIFLVDKTFKINIQSGIIRAMLYSLIFLALLWVFYKFQHLLLRNKAIAKLIPFTSLTHYKFWGRYKSIPEDRWKKTT